MATSEALDEGGLQKDEVPDEGDEFPEEGAVEGKLADDDSIDMELKKWRKRTKCGFYKDIRIHSHLFMVYLEFGR